MGAERDAVAPRAGGRVARRAMGLAALACIAVQLPGSLWLSALALALWLALLAALDRPSLGRLWMPRFWGISLIFATSSGLLLGPAHEARLWGVLSLTGLEAGVLMMVRGAFIFGLATWASRSLSGERLEALSRRLGLPRLGRSLGTALGLLPTLQERLQSARHDAGSRGSRGRWPGIRATAIDLLCQTARLAEEMATARQARAAAGIPHGRADRPKRRRRLLVAVVGTPGSGKTTLVSALARQLERGGLSAGGIVQPAIHEGERRVGYQLMDVASGERHPLARRRENVGPGELGYTFDEGAWSWGQRRIAVARRERDLVLVDELGRLEAEGGGHLPALGEALADERPGILLLAVRADRRTALEERLGPFDLIIPTDQMASPESLAGDIVRRWQERLAAVVDEQPIPPVIADEAGAVDAPAGGTVPDRSPSR